MKEIVKYEDNGGALWDTKEEAMLADSNLVLREFFSLYCSHYELDEWIDGAKKDPNIKNIIAFFSYLFVASANDFKFLFFTLQQNTKSSACKNIISVKRTVVRH